MLEEIEAFCYEPDPERPEEECLRPVTLEYVWENLTDKERFAFDLETTGLSPYQDEIVGVGLCGSPERAFYVPVREETPTPKELTLIEASTSTIVGVPLGDVLRGVAALLNTDKEKIGHNLKFDLAFLRESGLKTVKTPILDTMLLSRLLDENRSAKLKSLGAVLLGIEMEPYKNMSRGKDIKTLTREEPEWLALYGAKDALVPYLLYELFARELFTTAMEPFRHYIDIEMPLLCVLLEMEKRGLPYDITYITDTHAQLHNALNEVLGDIYETLDKIYRERNKPRNFPPSPNRSERYRGLPNVNSPDQLAVLFYAHLDLPVLKRTGKKDAGSTDKEALNGLLETVKGKDPDVEHFLERLLEYRELYKIWGTYISPIFEGKYSSKSNGEHRVRTSFQQLGAVTGRLSSREPNLQNIPAHDRYSVRKAFRPPAGRKFIIADYNQIELRLLAHFSQDETLLRAYREGDDIHRKTAAAVFGVPEDQVTSQQRRYAKTINFGIVYGMRARALSRELGVGVDKAEAFLANYFKQFPGVKIYIASTKVQCRRDKYVSTITGRRRHLPDINSTVDWQREKAEKMAVNSIVQGSAADLIKLVMVELFRREQRGEAKSRMLHQVHDELIFEVPEEDAQEEAAVIKEIMEQVPMEKLPGLSVPILVDVSIGDSWAEKE